MTPLDFAVQMAPLIGADGVTTYASPLNGINLQDGDKAAIAIAITQGLQEIFGLGPTALSEQLYGAALQPPANVTFNATQYSETISGFTGWQSWMEGCTIRGGDADDNELISATQLVRPYMAGSGAVSATVYADAIKLPDWVKNTMDPVWTPRAPQLRSAGTREEFLFYNSPNIDGRAHHHAHHHSYGAYYMHKAVGVPCVYFVEGRYDPTTGALPLFMRFNPMPGQAYPITFRVKRKPPVITAADLVPLGLTVTGTLVLDATGVYRLMGAANTNNSDPGAVYVRDSSANNGELFVIVNTAANEGGAWFIRNVGGDLVWTGPTNPSPVGTYAATGDNTGTATVTASTGTNLVIPTDWHESVLLPFAKRWFIGHPAFGNPSAAAQIMAQYQVAKQTLESFIPQIAPMQGHYK